jgi:hypothetical protein
MNLYGPESTTRTVCVEENVRYSVETVLLTVCANNGLQGLQAR